MPDNHLYWALWRKRSADGFIVLRVTESKDELSTVEIVSEEAAPEAHVEAAGVHT
jgi:hypothetical protein